MKGSGANTWAAGGDEERQLFVLIEDVFKGRHFGSHRVVRELVDEHQTELAGSGNHDGGSGDLRNPS